MMIAICESAAKTTRVPVAIALDHGKNMDNINRCLELGVSVMFDGSHYPVTENIRLTKEWSSALTSWGCRWKASWEASAGGGW